MISMPLPDEAVLARRCAGSGASTSFIGKLEMNKSVRWCYCIAEIGTSGATR